MTNPRAPQPFSFQSQAVQWALLVYDLERLHQAHGWGMAAAWSEVHDGNYATARERTDEALALFDMRPATCILALPYDYTCEVVARQPFDNSREESR